MYAFYCFSAFMKQVECNFWQDGSGMQTRLDKTAKVLETVLPDLYAHLRKVDCLNLFICYRWYLWLSFYCIHVRYLVLFKREFSIQDTCLLWESIFTSEHQDYSYFLAVAILEQHVDHLLCMSSFDEMLKYVNSLAMKISAVEILERAELLFLPHQMMENESAQDADDFQ